MKLSPQIFAKVLNSLQQEGPSAGSEKRLFTRMEVQTKLALATLVDGKVAKSYTALTRDVSCSGVGLLSTLEIKHGEKFLACFPYEKKEIVFLCVAMFTRALANGIWAVGSQFDSVPEPALIEEFSKARGIDPKAGHPGETRKENHAAAPL